MELSYAINAEEYIHDRGTRPDELAKAVHEIAPQVQFWYKEHTTIEDLDSLINHFKYPVGVEWQNLFYETIEEEMEDTDGQPWNYDFGHYSIVTAIDVDDDQITMVDPYFEFEETYRYFSLRWFESRWYDINPQPMPGHQTRDDRVSFIITIKGTPFPKLLGYKPLS